MSWTEDEDMKKKALTGNENESVAVNEDTLKTDTLKAEQSVDRSDSVQLWTLLENTLKENLIEKRRARRWKVFFRVIYLCVFVVSISLVFDGSNSTDVNKSNDFVAVISLEGQIGAGQPIDANVTLDLLNDAYAHSGIQALVLKMNSPGGSPVHSGIIYDAIQLKRAQYPFVPVYVVVEDLVASGGYYIAAAADSILVDKASLVGSIGVISAGFDATELLEKIGIKRRVFTAGENKAFLDPFLPMEESSVVKWQAVLDETHQQFIKAVKEGRGDRLSNNPDLFTGAVFSGVKAVELGLVDNLSSYHQLINENYAGVEVVYFEPEKDPWEKAIKSFGVSVVNAFLAADALK